MTIAACELSNTGLPVPVLAVVGLTCLLAGGVAFVYFGARRHRARAGGALVLLLVVGGVVGGFGGGSVGGGSVGGGSVAHAASAAGTSVRASATVTGATVTATEAAAASEDCPGGGAGGGAVGGGEDSTLTVIQTSVNTGIVPGSAPTTLAGTITNHGTASATIRTVTVSIERVSTASGAAAGACDASDYVLQDAAMPVARTLAAGETAGFSGASIGFSEKGTNQDACKGATLHLLYVSS